MPTFNHTVLVGNLTADPELRYTPKGTPIAQFNLAVNRSFKAENTTREEVSYFEVEAWGAYAKLIGEKCSKGDPLLVSGRLRQDRWQDRESGQNRSKVKVVLETFQFLNRSSGGAGGADEQQGSPDDQRNPY